MPNTSKSFLLQLLRCLALLLCFFGIIFLIVRLDDIIMPKKVTPNQQNQYLIVSFGKETKEGREPKEHILQKASELSREGWELVSVCIFPPDDRITIFFKKYRK